MIKAYMTKNELTTFLVVSLAHLSLGGLCGAEKIPWELGYDVVIKGSHDCETCESMLYNKLCLYYYILYAY